MADNDNVFDTLGDDNDMFVPLSVKRELEAQRMSKKMEEKIKGKRSLQAAKEESTTEWTSGPLAKKSLLEMNIEAMKNYKGTIEQKQEENREREEQELEDMVMGNEGKQLRSIFDSAHGITYDSRMKNNFVPPKYVQNLTNDQVTFIRDREGIVVEGNDVPNPCLSFRDFGLPKSCLNQLSSKGILTPTPIQKQAIPVILSGRDFVGVAYTGSGKTLAFIIPMVVANIRDEKLLPIKQGEGPFSVAITPSRELANQHYDTYTYLSENLDHPIRCLPAIGGIRRDVTGPIMRQGFHSCIATPGRLKGHLNSKDFSLKLCNFVCLDEADRLVDQGFDDDIREIYQFIRHQRQTIMFSATMPKKAQAFLMSGLTDPISVNFNRAGAANLNVVQEVEFVSKEDKPLYLLDCLQKTSPPVLIFAMSKQDVDYIQEYLLVKCVEAVAIHGDKTQEERSEAIRRFRSGSADVLIGTDVASKGLDFPSIQHVINYDLPKEIEHYVHRIGRTGRCGKTGIATTFINKSCPETTLLDLKYLLIEAKQVVPQVLKDLEDPNEGKRNAPCAYCGGLGHMVSVCPKLQQDNKKNYSSGFGGGGEM
eukprot:TRINITY_DN14681_c0_g1_i1.p1 TRINITY_DN14681_c0_g1~~TRINITY_DN14681_c0_g1_i1.p1  ORF type:complete len:611 (+),score=114.03 TRINITY_DN14681_c0_g1_i1:58-1833(+)